MTPPTAKAIRDSLDAPTVWGEEPEALPEPQQHHVRLLPVIRLLTKLRRAA